MGWDTSVLLAKAREKILFRALLAHHPRLVQVGRHLLALGLGGSLGQSMKCSVPREVGLIELDRTVRGEQTGRTHKSFQR